jgi:methyl-accepting chemotaxis protein
MAELTRSFDQQVTTVLETVWSDPVEMRDAAHSMTETAETTSRQSTTDARRHNYAALTAIRKRQEAAIGTRDVSETLGEVSAAAGHTGKSAAVVLDVASRLSGEASGLKQEVDRGHTKYRVRGPGRRGPTLLAGGEIVLSMFYLLEYSS